MMRGKGQPGTIDPQNYPALREFLPAYLHEDFGGEYGSAAKAMTALVSDASADQIRILREEWRRLRRGLAGQPLHAVQQALVEIGAAWHPRSERELQEVDEILSRAEA